MRLKNLTISIFLLLSFTLTVFAQTGKISGRVVDNKGEPLVGASVRIQGTTMGAATNVDGDYVILNVPPGSYTVRCTYVGYNPSTVSNIKVSVGLTTTLNFTLTSEAIQLGEVVRVAERPLIQKNATNTTNIVRSEDIELLPIRGVNNIVATQAGVVTQAGNVHVRGSRADAVTYYIDGVLVNNIVFGGNRTSVITNAIEEIQFQPSGYSAEYGGANGGIISTQTRTGKETYNFSVEAITDNFKTPGNEYPWGGFAYGYSEYVLTAGGPVIPTYKNLKFFFAGSNVFQRTPAAFYRGANLPNLFERGNYATFAAAAKAGDTVSLIAPDGKAFNAHQNTYNLQGNLVYDLAPIQVRLNGTFTRSEGRNGVGLTALNNYVRAGVNQSHTITSSMKFSHVVGSNAFYDLTLSYFGDYYVDYDPVFKDNITAYGDSIENAKTGVTLRRDGVAPTPIYAYGYTFTRRETPYNFYRKQKTISWGGKLNFTYQLGTHHELKLGGELTTYLIRRYSHGNPMGIASNIKANPEGDLTEIYTRVDNYGYDSYGNPVDEGIDGPKKPLFAGVYFKDKIEYSDLVIDAGLRLDYINIDGKVFKDPSRVQFDENDRIDPAGLENVEPYMHVSPRLGFSFPVTDRTVFHAQYGKFIQQSRLRDVYQGWNLVADNIKGGFAISQPVGFGLKPERTIQYEIGFTQQVGDIFSFDVTAFYKDIKDQVQIRSIYAGAGATHRQYYAWVNGDFATTKGFELRMDLRRVQRVAANVSYTYSDAQGTGSNPSTGFRMIWQSPTAVPFFPQQIAPLDFNQTHRGSINLDYRFGNNDGPSLFGQKILQNFGLSMLFTFTSGYNFTKSLGYDQGQTPLEALNTSTTPWTFQLDAKLDKTVKLGPFSFNIYLWVINVLNTQNVVGVFNQTGDAYDDGWLTSPEGISRIEGYRTYGEEYAQNYINLYKALTYNAGNFGTPRQIRLGIRLNY